MYFLYFTNPRQSLYFLVPGERLVCFFNFNCVMYTYTIYKNTLVLLLILKQMCFSDFPEILHFSE